MMGYTNNGSSGTIPPDTTNGYPQGYSINLGLGSPSTGTNPLFTYDIVGHEFMHAVDKFSVNIAASNSYDFEERFILYEGMCDIMGITIESKYKQNDWIIGNDANYPDIRNLQNPHFSNSMNGYDIINFIPTFGSQPKIYQEPSKWISPTTLPSGTVTDLSGNTVNLDQRSRTAYAHHNNGVLNYWFYLLAEGNPNPLGVDIASNIAFLTWKDEFVSYGDKNFHSFRDATLKVTHEKYDCNTWETVRQAWDAVGVTGSTCEIAVKITTTCPSPSTCTANITTCGGSAAGTRIKISGGGLAAPIKISATQHNATNLVCGNTYTVEVTDKNNPAECVIIKNFTCQANTTGSINLPCPPSTIMTASYNVITNCNGNDITGSVTGGILPYTYNWSNGSTSQNLTNVPSGTYGLTVSDDGCSNYQESFNVNGLVPLNVSGQIIHSACNSMPPPPHHPPTTNDGSSINITVSGGLSPYTYSWSNGVTTQNVSNLTPNAYTVTVTDGNGCTKVQTFSIGAPEPNILNVSIFNACPIANDGEIINVTIGGTPPYSYQWSGPGNSQTVESPIGVASGTHYVTVTDANGCTDIATRFVAPAPSSWVYDYENCEKVYTCHGNSYSEDMLDYANIINIDEEDCTGEINCLIVGGTPSPMSGNISYYVDWGFLNNNPHCEQDCYMNGSLVGTVDAPSTISSYMILSTEINSCDGDYYDIYCDGQLTGYYCDEEDIAISILIGMNPNWESTSLTNRYDTFNGSYGKSNKWWKPFRS